MVNPRGRPSEPIVVTTATPVVNCPNALRRTRAPLEFDIGFMPHATKVLANRSTSRGITSCAIMRMERWTSSMGIKPKFCSVNT